MGISTHVCRAIFREHKYRPLVGNGLLIGRQSIQFTSEQFKRIAQLEALDLRTVDFAGDKDTRAGGDISDIEFFLSFCDLNIQAMDVSDYEQASIVHDMNFPIPNELSNKFDFIYDGSCMDNLFNPGIFVANCAKMLRTGGRIIHFEHGSAWPGAYLSYSPDWFFDFYCDNKFADVQVLVGSFPGTRSPHHLQSNWTVYRWNPCNYNDLADHSYHTDANHRMLIIVAEKGPESTDNIYPIQRQYISWGPEDWEAYGARCRLYNASKRMDNWRLPVATDWRMGPAVSSLEFIGYV